MVKFKLHISEALALEKMRPAINEAFNEEVVHIGEPSLTDEYRSLVQIKPDVDIFTYIINHTPEKAQLLFKIIVWKREMLMYRNEV